ncbi:MAG: hypothetical protein ACMUIE_08660, partial [Thermoplasmatota archaeon]
MNKELLPPGSELRIWKGREFRVSTLYSVAGISTTIFVDTNSGRLLLDCGDGTLRDSIELLRKDMEAPGGMQEVTVLLQNQGSSTLTSAQIHWTVNGEPQGTYPWTGNLDPASN